MLAVEEMDASCVWLHRSSLCFSLPFAFSSHSYLEQVKRSEATRVGQAVLDLYSQGNTSDVDFLQQVKELASKAQSTIDAAETAVEEHGRHKFDE